MKQRILSACVVLCLVTVAWASAVPDVKFRRLDTRDGLTSSQVNCIMRDSKGFVWLCTPFGLCRYDGYRFRNYFSYVRDSTTLRANRVDWIEEDANGGLWLDHGMSYSFFDPTTEICERNPTSRLAKLGITGSVEKLHIDSKKNFWVKTYDNGFFIYNAKTKRVQHMNFGYGMDEFPKEFGASAFAESAEGMLIVSKMGGLMCIDGDKGLVVWKEDFVGRNLNSYNDYWVYSDKRFIWVITHSVGTYIYDREQKRWYKTLTELMRDMGFRDVPDDIVVWEVKYDKSGNLWVATDHLGVFVLDMVSKEWRAFANVKNDDTSLPDMTAKHLYEDQLGRMWVATYKNGVAMSSDAMANFSSLPFGDINAICEDRNGFWWLGMNTGGIKKVDPETLEVIEEYNKHTIPVQNDVIVGSYAANDGSLWFGTWEGGAIRYKNGQWSNLLSTDPGSQLMTNNVWGVTADRQGNIWLGVLGGGAVRIDKNTGKQRAFNEQNSKLRTVWTNSITLGSNGWILLGNSEYCSLINPVSMKVVNLSLPQDESSFTISPATAQIIMDSHGLIWQASPSGLMIYDRKAGVSKLLDMKSGFYGSNVVSLCEDANGAIWVVTDHGVSSVTPQKNEKGQWTFAVRSFNDRDGLQPGPFNQRAICYTSKGYVLVGGQDGLDVINTNNLGESGQAEHPVFSGLLLFDEEVPVGKEVDGRVVLDEALDVCRYVSVRFNDQITIQLASNAGLVKNGKRFVYRLEGFNENWVKTAENNPNITYNSLRPGTYTLCVRMLNDDGTIGEKEEQLEIHIVAPYYRTRWAILLYVLLVAVVAFLWRRWFMKKQLEKAELERIRREAEKRQWMNEAKAQLLKEQGRTSVDSAPHTAPVAEPVVADADGDAVIVEVESAAAQELPPLELQCSETDFVAFVRDQSYAFRSPDGKKFKLMFNSNVDSLPVYFDTEQMGKALQILLTNSARFSPAGSKIQVTVISPNKKRVNLLVADNGIGINPEFKAHMFDPVPDDSEGIGLDKVKRIIDAHQGTIHADSNPGGGTVFIIGLPVEEEIPDAVIIEE